MEIPGLIRWLDCSHGKHIRTAGPGVQEEGPTSPIVTRRHDDYHALVDQPRPDRCPGAFAEPTLGPNTGTYDVRAVVVSFQERLDEDLLLADVGVSEDLVGEYGRFRGYSRKPSTTSARLEK